MAHIIGAGKEISDEDVAQKFFPDIKGGEKQKNRLNQLKTRLMRLVLEFLAVENFRKNEALSAIFALESLVETKDGTGYDQQYQRVQKLMKKGVFRGSEQHFWQFRVMRTRSRFLNLMNKRKIKENLPDTLLALERFFEIERLIVTCVMLNQEQIFGEVSEVGEILELEKLEQLSDDLLCQGYLKVYIMFTSSAQSDADEAYHGLKEMLTEEPGR
ncbi:MAG: hypothetical protein AAF570_20815, partial [Bacteroidota bacterium]